MIDVVIPASEKWDPVTDKFKSLDKDYKLTLEHSLISVSKWEQRWHKPFMSDKDKSYEETIDYIKCMTITQGVPDVVYEMMPDNVITQINEYITDSATATTFYDSRAESSVGASKRKEVITAEIVYYWMIELSIPVEICQKWHFNRLMTLIRVINIKHEERDPNKKHKMSKRDILAHNAQVNAARRKAMRSKG